MQTIFSQAKKKRHSNVIGALPLITGLTSSLGGVLDGACFGDAACQANRELQSQASLTTAQAQLAATQVAAMHEQNEAKNSQVLLYVGIGFMVVVLILGSIFLLKKK
jgi:hypothetical protein